MGKKKGRQCGQYARKSQRAAHVTELRERASEAHHQHPAGGAASSASRGYASAATVGVASSATATTTSTPPRLLSLDGELPTPRSRPPGMGGRVGTAMAASNLLRHMLEERRWEDRAEEREGRRRMHRLHRQMSLGAGRGDKGVEESSSSGDGGRRNDVGWLMEHETEEDRLRRELHSATRHALRRRRGGDVPPLTTLCAAALGPVLTEYVAAWGPGAVGDAVSSLPPHLLAALSVSASAGAAGVTDDVVSVLVGGGRTGTSPRGAGGAHFVDRLTLHAAAVVPPGEVNGRGSVATRAARKTLLTYGGISQLIPRRVRDPPGRRRGADGVVGGDEDDDDDGDHHHHHHHHDDVADSWESIVDVDRHLNLGGCPRLVRLELANLSSSSSLGCDDATFRGGVSRGAMFHLLRGCPTLTHLGIVNCFHDDVATGPDLLLNRVHGIGAILKRLKVLDVSDNAWVNDAILTAFLGRFCVARGDGDGDGGGGGGEDRRGGGGRGCVGGKKKNVLLQPSLISVTGCANVTARVREGLCRRYGVGGRPPLISAEVQRNSSSLAPSPSPLTRGREGVIDQHDGRPTTSPRSTGRLPAAVPTAGAYAPSNDGWSGYRPQHRAMPPQPSSAWAGGGDGEGAGGWCADDEW